MFACIYLPDFLAQAALLQENADDRNALRQSPIVVLDGPASTLKVVALNQAARRAGIATGMTKLQVEACGGVLLRKRSHEIEIEAENQLLGCAKAFSPQVEFIGPGTVILDLAGTGKLFGTWRAIANKILKSAMERGFVAQVAIASNPDAASYAARGFKDITVIPEGQEAEALSRLKLDLLPATPEMLEILESWGIHTFQDLAALPEVPLTARLGQEGLNLQRLARGQAQKILVPVEQGQKFVESCEFDDPVETFEPLAFVFNRLLEELCARLVANSLATRELRLTLDLAVSQRCVRNDGEQYQHEWKLPVPTQDKNILLTLIRLNLERQAFIAPIRKVALEILAIKPRSAQGNLFAPPSPEAERLEITLARLRGVVGDNDINGIRCVGSPETVDTHKPDSFCVQSFCVDGGENSIPSQSSIIALRVFRPALSTTVELTGETSHLISFGRKYRRVLAAFGPWSSSGNWWNNAWARDEWDVAVKTTVGVGLYRIYFDRLQERWFVDGMFD